MAVTRLNNIRPEMLVWAFERAGFNEERAVKAFPKLASWLSGEKLPTVNQLQQFAKRFYVPFGYLLDCYEHREKLVTVCKLNYQVVKEKYTERLYIDNMDKIYEKIR